MSKKVAHTNSHLETRLKILELVIKLDISVEIPKRMKKVKL
jgi:hypothetical protein